MGEGNSIKNLVQIEEWGKDKTIKVEQYYLRQYWVVHVASEVYIQGVESFWKAYTSRYSHKWVW